MKTKVEARKAGAAQFEHVEAGIYRNLDSGTYFERPKIRGKRTWRSLETKNLKHAREELHKRRSGQKSIEAEKSMCNLTVGDIIRRYQKDGYPDRHKEPRQGRTLDCEKRNSKLLLKFFDRFLVTEISLALLDKYRVLRKEHITRGTGDRAVDLELNTLSNALLWGMRCDIIKHNPINFRRPRYNSAKNVRHCREFMPHNTEALHEIASVLFADIRSETLGWQMMFEAFTGLRTCEALKMRIDAQPYEPGWIMIHYNRASISVLMTTLSNARWALRTTGWWLLALALVSGCSPSEPTRCRILPVGDSISVGYTDNSAWTVPFEFGYRGPLFEMFQNAGVPVQFVGNCREPWNGIWGIPTNQPLPDLRPLDQDHHEAYGGKDSAFVAEHIGSWVRKNKPDFVLLMIGINDIPPGSTNFPPAAQTNLQVILQTVMRVRPATHVIIAQTIPYIQPTPGILAFNRFIREKLVPDFVARGAKVSTVDQSANFVSDPNDSAGDPSLYSNGYNHPNPKGYQRMAQTWFNEIQRQRSLEKF